MRRRCLGLIWGFLCLWTAAAQPAGAAFEDVLQINTGTAAEAREAPAARQGPQGRLAVGDVLVRETGERCIVTDSVCVEAGGTRYVEGVAVTRDCWATRETYTCLAAVDAGNGSEEGDAATVDGCATLNQEAQGINAAHCRKTASTCAETVTGVSGESVCVREKENWACEQKIELPPFNAEWTGTTTAVEETIDESACAALEANAACVKDEIACTDSGCTRAYLCGGRRVEGCSVLINAGCTSVSDPVCDAAVDPECAIKRGEVSCKGELPDGVIESGAADIEDSSTVNVGMPTPDASACASLETEGTSCKQISQTCVDRDPIYRVINGKGYTMPCWGYERVMQCTTTNPENTCAALQKEEACVEKERVCSKADDAGCLEWRLTYACGAKAEDVDAGDSELVGESSDIAGVVEVSTCTELEANPVCRKTEEACLEGPATKIVSGVPVYKDCWKSEATYVCGSGDERPVTEDDCSALASDASCTKTGSVCLSENDKGECTMRTDTYVCGGGSEEVEVGEVCDQELCIAGLCAPGAVENGSGSEFLEGIALMEIIRQAGVYGEAGTDSLFGGTASACTVKAAGFSCCRTENAETASSMNNEAFGVAAMIGIEAGTELIKYVGSPYVYDILSEYEATSGLLTALYGTAGSGVYTPSFSYYGVSVTTGTSGSLVLEFSPLSFMASVALEMASDYFSCSESDRMHVLRESRGLCHYVGSYCDKKSGAGCLEKKESWVCFNSKLARIVQEEGRKQLGLGWGTPEAPLARGFQLSEFQALDFSRMDLSAIVSEVAIEASKNGISFDQEAVLARSRKRVEEIASGGDQYVTVDSITGKCATAGGCRGSAWASLSSSAGMAFLLSGYGELVEKRKALLRNIQSRTQVRAQGLF